MKTGIVGAGIMGSLLAFALEKLGFEVTIFDHNHDMNCSKAAAGLLTPWTELEKNDAIIFDIGMAAILQHWPMILTNMPNEIFFQKRGSLAIAHPNDQVELDNMMAFCRHPNLPITPIKKLMHQDIVDLEPDLHKFQTGFYFSEEGQIDNQSFLKTIEKYLSDKIIWHKNMMVDDIQPRKIMIKNRVYQYDWVFDCRGLGAKAIFTDLRGIRGELIWLYAPDVSLTRPIRFFHPRYRLYIVPRPNHIYLLGASEIEAEDQTEISVRSALELLTAAYYVQPKFAEARIIKMVTHARPTLADHLPKIKYTNGFIAVNGLYRHGFLLAPTLMHEIKQFLLKGTSALSYPALWEHIDDQHYF